MSSKKLKVSFCVALNELDSEKQTFACRANPLDICANNSIPGMYAFVSDDNICKTHLVYGRKSTLN